jgi:hypothetical protein
MNRFLLCVISLTLVPALLPAATHTVKFTVSAGKHDHSNEPVCLPLRLPAEVKPIDRVEITHKGKHLATGQVMPAGLLTEQAKTGSSELHFILPSLKAGERLDLEAVIEYARDTRDVSKGFRWVTTSPAETELRFGDRPVLRYVHPKLDESTKQSRIETFKVFHHVLDPTGKSLLTKGPGGLYTHHRGLFYGFMKTSYDKQTVDTWHCPDPGDKKKAKQEAHQAHVKELQSVAGPVLGRHRVEIAWNGVGKKTFAREQRELTVYNVPGGTLIEFVSLLTPVDGPVKVDGDPQHAGFHFRASNEVAQRQEPYDKAMKIKDASKREEALKKIAVNDLTIFIRPDGAGKPGTERNWDGKKNKTHINLPWLAMSYIIGGQRYTTCYLDKPSNPKEARFSERAYGRFGSYFVTTATKEKPLLVDYRVWVQQGLMKGEEVAAKSKAFVEPATAKLK